VFLQIASGSTRKSAETQATGLIITTRDIPFFLRSARWLLRLIERSAALAHDRRIDRRLQTLRWCDSTERALLDDSAGRRWDR
jgi:hypothetical protein